MRCSNCGVCCKETMMELSSDDINMLEEEGFRLEEVTVRNDSGTQLRNVGGYCYFYDLIDGKCQIYKNKPIGCSTYPVVHLENEGMIIDELCPMGQTISKYEMMKKGKILDKLLKKIDIEL